MKKVCIIILNYKSYEDTIRLAFDLKENLRYPIFKVVVVDNASPNESQEKLEEAFKDTDITFIQSGRNGGFASGNNVGIRYGIQNGYDVSLIMNNDIYIERDYDFLTKIVAVLDGKVVMASPAMYNLDDTIFPLRHNRVSFSFFFKKKKKLAWEQKETEVKTIEGAPFKVYMPHGGCMVIDNNFLKEIGLMDERTFLYWEEAILGEQAIRRKYEVRCVPDAKVTHYNGKTVKNEHSFESLLMLGRRSVKWFFVHRYGPVIGRMAFLFYTVAYRLIGLVQHNK